MQPIDEHKLVGHVTDRNRAPRPSGERESPQQRALVSAHARRQECGCLVWIGRRRGRRLGRQECGCLIWIRLRKGATRGVALGARHDARPLPIEPEEKREKLQVHLEEAVQARVLQADPVE